MSVPPPILLVKRGDVTRADLDLARKAGVLVIQSRDPVSIRFIDAPIAKGNMARVADALVREIMAGARSSIDRDDIRVRLAQVMLAQEQPLTPPMPKPVAP